MLFWTDNFPQIWNSGTTRSISMITYFIQIVIANEGFQGFN
jgi:hypothetical protein